MLDKALPLADARYAVAFHTESRLPPPQSCLLSPAHGMLQSVLAARVEPISKLFPQKHSCEYSVPAKLYPKLIQKPPQSSFVMTLLLLPLVDALLRVRMPVTSVKQPA